MQLRRFSSDGCVSALSFRRFSSDGCVSGAVTPAVFLGRREESAPTCSPHRRTGGNRIFGHASLPKRDYPPPTGVIYNALIQRALSQTMYPKLDTLFYLSCTVSIHCKTRLLCRPEKSLPKKSKLMMTESQRYRLQMKATDTVTSQPASSAGWQVKY